MSFDCYLNDRVLSFVNDNKLYSQFEIRVEVKSKYDLQSLLNFLEKVTNHDLLRFDKITVTDSFYKYL
jgi:hypothetical protein